MDNVLLTAVGCPGAGSIIELLKPYYKLCGVDRDIDAYGFHLIPGEVVPDASLHGPYLGEIMRIIKTLHMKFVLPMSTNELLPLTSIKQFVKTTYDCTILVSSHDRLEAAIDKGLLYTYFNKFDFIPQFVVARTPQDLFKLPKQKLWAKTGFFVKPCRSNGSRGLYRIVSDSDAANYRLDFTNKPMPYGLLSFREFIARLTSQGMDEVGGLLVSEFLEGREWSVDLISDVYTVTRIRDEIRSGICTKGHLDFDKKLIDISQQIVKKLGLQFNVNLQFIETNNGFKLLEINPRVSGTIVLSSQVVNLPRLALLVAAGRLPILRRTGELPSDSAFTLSAGVAGTCMTRHYKEIFY